MPDAQFGNGASVCGRPVGFCRFFDAMVPLPYGTDLLVSIAFVDTSQVSPHRCPYRVELQRLDIGTQVGAAF